MKLNEAVLCIDCDEIYIWHGPNSCCPSCFSSIYIPLTRFIVPIVRERNQTVNNFIDNKIKLHKIKRYSIFDVFKYFKKTMQWKNNTKR